MTSPWFMLTVASVLVIPEPATLAIALFLVFSLFIAAVQFLISGLITGFTIAPANSLLEESSLIAADEEFAFRLAG